MSARGRKRADGSKAEQPPHEFYPTPPWPVRMLLQQVELPGGEWLEPCCGNGAVIKAVSDLRSDINWDAVDIREDCGYAGAEHLDFLSVEPPDTGPLYDVVLTNPPFSLALPFVEHSMAFARHVVMLMRIGFTETEERSEFCRSFPCDLYALPKRPSFTGRGSDSTLYAWFHWHPAASRKYTILRETCYKCGRYERNARGDCKACGRTGAAERRRKFALEQPVCGRCGQRDWTARGTCRSCRQLGYDRLAGTKCATCGDVRNKFGSCPTCKRQWVRQRQGVLDATGESGIGKTCAVCGVVLTSNGPAQYALDHDHKTGKARGWLCVRCNAGLGNFGESEEKLRAAIGYLNRWGAP